MPTCADCFYGTGFSTLFHLMMSRYSPQCNIKTPIPPMPQQYQNSIRFNLLTIPRPSLIPSSVHPLKRRFQTLTMVSLTSKLLAFAYVLTDHCMLVTAASPNGGQEPAYGVMHWQRPWIPSWWEGFEERGTWYQCTHIRLPDNEIHDKGGEPGGEHTGNLDARAGGRAYDGMFPPSTTHPL